MTDAFFGMSPKNLLEDAKKELDDMKKNFNPTTIRHFFVDTYHIIDHVKNLPKPPTAAIEEMGKDSDFQMCKFICNKGKHLKLTQQAYPVLGNKKDADTERTTPFGGYPGGAHSVALALGDSHP
jgi:hypothetical protein